MNNTSDSNSSQTGRCVFEPLCTAAGQGANRARTAAEQAIPKIKAAAWCATYWVGYGTSFASVFSYTVLKDLAPEALKAGCREGAQAGRKAVEDLSAKLKARSAARQAGVSPEPDPSATQPGVA